MKSPQGNHHNFKQAQTTIQFLLGPIKIKDGLFIGDQFAAKDIEFIISNKVTHIINTVSRSIPNLYEKFGVQYLSVHWSQKQENIYDKKNNAVNAIYNFVEQAMENGESCLIHSIFGKSRSCAVLVAYLMKKYNWSLSKCLQLVNSKKEGIEIRNNYLSQMQELEKRNMQSAKLTNSWSEIKNQEDLLLANTFNNGKKATKVQSYSNRKPACKKITWDEKSNQKYFVNSNGFTLTRYVSKGEKKQQLKLKSILKGFPNLQQSQPYANYRDAPTPIKQSEAGFSTTVNNFMKTEKKSQQTGQMFNSRPYSSDTKDRDKKINPYDLKQNKLFAYDNSMATSIKTAIQSKVYGKQPIPSTVNKLASKKKEQIKNPAVGSRPDSALPDRTKKSKNMFGEDLMISGNNAKRRNPSSSKEQIGKYK